MHFSSFIASDARYFRGGLNRKIHETDKFGCILIPHFLQETDMFFLCVFIDGVNVIGTDLCQRHIDLSAVPGGAMTHDIFFPVQAAENVRDPS